MKKFLRQLKIEYRKLVNLKNINKLFILLFLSLFVSCSSINLLEKVAEEALPQTIEELETDETISSLEFNTHSNYNDYFSKIAVILLPKPSSRLI